MKSISLAGKHPYNHFQNNAEFNEKLVELATVYCYEKLINFMF